MTSLSPRPTQPSGAPRPLSARSSWHLAANAPVVVWLLATFGVSLVHREVAVSAWLLVHLTLLGAVTNAILVWSAHFADALLRRRTDGRARRGQAVRLVVLNVGVLTTVVGMVTSRWPVTLVGAAVVGLAVAWHGAALARSTRGALTGPLAVCVRFYVAAAWLLPFGAAVGVLLARGAGPGWHARLVLAHTGLNVLGFVGLTVLGTLVTLWPTMLRTTMDPRAVRAVTPTLAWTLGGLGVGVVGALTGVRLLAAAGVVAYVVGVVCALVPMVGAARRRPPASFATLSAASAVVWWLGTLATAVVLLVVTPSWTALEARLGALTVPLVGGFAAQVLLGALTYLVPVVLGGGPAVVRTTAARLERGALTRIVVANGGLLVFVLPGSSALRALSSIAALGAGASFLVLLALALRDHRRARLGRMATVEAPEPPVPGTPQGPQVEAVRGPARATQLAAGVAVLALVVAGAAALDPSGLRLAAMPGGGVAGGAAGASVTPTGRTTTVEVEARDMRFTPSRIEVPAGDRLVLVVRNTDPTTVHDLALDTGAFTGRLAVGASATLDVGVVGRTIEGWCTIVGHRQSGMTLDIVPTGLAAAGDAAPGATDAPSGGTDDGGMNHSRMDHGSASGPSAADDIDLHQAPPAGFEARDASLPPLDDRTVREVTLTVSELTADVAPGVSQKLWTFGGSAPGPTLHGRVGDTFVVTLVNDGTIGHSIDFHAGMLAPDQPMRTIAPGETLTYRFTATMSGIWMYHCSTMPMSAHIANGMFGAVVIEPPDLPEVDASYVLVQSEFYLGAQGGEVDVDKIATQLPDLVTFNGYAHQYAYDPIEARTGDRLRIWVLAAGPNVGTSFHVVGGQFDTVFHEGTYRLRPGNAARGGSQALGLSVAQGGFVELVMPEAGTYPFVSHVMSDAEKGATGRIHVTD
ncbi:multicopper oxidase domain-containing protein [Flavimobilis sp. GY10621]|uniref:Copper-containing nitrite reductase n=1 Tax=Flavimobilis rhizosphaerae TaxID=2775421 RepID=A0ABR9DMV0_9MICO|nr:multicopper oxidase domain-containing protein [Flavimobilis rhizosphaerae]MBD9698289.1 multicopper oxidase domain-containing protein [Flavimobilis rhizosphaerae]